MQFVTPTYPSFLSLFAAALIAFALPAQTGATATGQAPPGHPPTTAPASSGSASQQDPAGQGQAKPKEAKKPAKKPREKPGISVDDVLVKSLCGRCHAVDDREHMTRISYVRKSPEGWSRSIKRMGRLHGLQLTTSQAKMLVRSLSNSHGLARKEAERGLYDSERRVHWSEDHHSDDFKRACAKCHPIGRALLQHRDKDEWQLLRATHVAMFPLSRGQIGGGPPRESSSRSSSRGGSGQAPSTGSSSNSSRRGGSSSANTSGSSSRRGGSSSGVGDRVLDQLSKDQPLFTPEWDAWTQNKREVPLQGVWSVHGHETGRGDIVGTLEMTLTAADEYDLSWKLRWSDGSSAVRTGKGVLYAGYSWRGRSKDIANDKDTTWREVLLLDDAWETFRGRIFTGAYDEIGADITLERDRGSARIVALGNAAIAVPTTDHALDVYGEAFATDLKASDFFIGQGLSITGLEHRSPRHVVLTIAAAAGTKLGTRTLAYGPRPGAHDVTLYDTVDYVRVRPLQGLSRNGGAKHPRQYERFEAYAVHRGKDGKPYSDDDIDLFQVRGKWALQEFAVRDNDDDLQYVGAIDATSGVFTPNIDGPNPQRKWQANNFGDVFVTFEATLDVPVRPPEPEKNKSEDEGENEGEDGETGGKADAASEQLKGGETETPMKVTIAQKTFFARSHLIVTVPIYARWQVLEWEDR